MTSIELFFAYKVFSLLTGGFIVFLGYKLFVVSVYSEQSSDIAATWGDKSVVLKRAAPGTLFSLFGAIVVSLAVFKGVSVDTSQDQPLPLGVIETISELPNHAAQGLTPVHEDVISKFDGLEKSNATSNFTPSAASVTLAAFEKMRNGYKLTPMERDFVWQWINLDQEPDVDRRTIPRFQEVSTYRQIMVGSPAP